MKNKTKKIFLSLLAFFIACLPFYGFSTSIKAASDAIINLSSKKQIIRGFGASSAWCGAINDSCMDTLYKNIGLDILRVRIEPNEGWNKGNYSAWAAELSNAKKVVARGGIVFATPWTPPASMKTNNSTVGTNNASLKTSSYADYANYLKTFINYYKDNGVSLYAISLQNEPDWPADYDGCHWTADQFHDFIKSYGSVIVNDTTKIMMPESLGFNTALADPTLKDSSTASYVSIIGGHLYGATIKDYPLAHTTGKDIWMTEHYYDNASISTSMTFAKEINDCMTIGNMNAYVYWWIINNDNGLYNTSGTPIKRAYVLGQFSKFVRFGYYRVDASSNPQSNVYISAYTGDNKVVIVAINQGTSEVKQNFSIQNGTVSGVSAYVTSSALDMAKSNAYINVANGSFTSSLPAQSVTTFVGDLSDVKPTPTPTSTVAPTPTPTVMPTPTPTVTPTPSPRSAFSQIEAEDFNSQSGVQTESCSEGGNDVAYIENGDYAVYNNINFGTGVESFEARASSATSGGNIEIRLDSINGPLLGTCPITGTGGWQTWATAKCNVSSVSGSHDLYLKFTGGSSYLFNFNWWKFNPIPSVKYGDINGDGLVDLVDYTLFKDYLLGKSENINLKNADINGDGNINSIDIASLKRILIHQ